MYVHAKWHGESGAWQSVASYKPNCTKRSGTGLPTPFPIDHEWVEISFLVPTLGYQVTCTCGRVWGDPDSYPISEHVILRENTGFFSA
jgi:hypothetical protein